MIIIIGLAVRIYSGPPLIFVHGLSPEHVEAHGPFSKLGLVFSGLILIVGGVIVIKGLIRRWLEPNQRPDGRPPVPKND